MGLIRKNKDYLTSTKLFTFHFNEKLFDEVGAELPSVSPPGGGMDCFTVPAKSSLTVSLWLTEEEYAELGRVASGGINPGMKIGDILEVIYGSDTNSCLFIRHPGSVYHSGILVNNQRMCAKILLINPFDKEAYLYHLRVLFAIPKEVVS